MRKDKVNYTIASCPLTTVVITIVDMANCIDAIMSDVPQWCDITVVIMQVSGA